MKTHFNRPLTFQRKIKKTLCNGVREAHDREGSADDAFIAAGFSWKHSGQSEFEAECEYIGSTFMGEISVTGPLCGPTPPTPTNLTGWRVGYVASWLALSGRNLFFFREIIKKAV